MELKIKARIKIARDLFSEIPINSHIITGSNYIRTLIKYIQENNPDLVMLKKNIMLRSLLIKRVFFTLKIHT